RELDRALAQLEQRSATLVFVRPIEPAAALRWATELHLQTPVAGDPNGDLARQLDAADQAGAPLEFAVVIVVDRTVSYRKLGGRRPDLDELLAVLDGESDNLRCCPDECAGSPCRCPPRRRRWKARPYQLPSPSRSVRLGGRPRANQ